MYRDVNTEPIEIEMELASLKKLMGCDKETVFSLILCTCNAIACYISQQSDPNHNNKLRWVLVDTCDDQCTCTKIRFGGINTISKEGLEKRFHTDIPLQLACKDEIVTGSKTTTKKATSPRTTTKTANSPRTTTTTSPRTTTKTATSTRTTTKTATSPRTTTMTTTSPTTTTMTATSPTTTTKTTTSPKTVTVTATTPKTTTMTATSPKTTTTAATSPETTTKTTILTATSSKASTMKETSPSTTTKTVVETSDTPITEKVTVTQQQSSCTSGQIVACTTPHALGMYTHNITDRRIVVSSRGTYTIAYSSGANEQYDSAQRARIDHLLYWAPRNDDPNPWVQVYVGLGKMVSGIIIQGFKQHWTRPDFIKVQVNGRNFESVNASPESAWIYDPESHTTLMFEDPVITSVIRIQPQDCLPITKNLANGNQIHISDCALRMEILGCKNTQDCGCVKPLGMESHQIHEPQIFVSSNDSKKNYARLHNGQFWPASPSNWIKVILNQKFNISGIVIQGSGDHWVERCIIEADSSAMFGSQEFEANFDGYAPVSIIFEEPVETRNIRVKPTVCYNGYCKLRMEILGPCMSG
ncbi:uncharacterized protein [Amphiura filiformis]|uniref:uncharacterized protein n=1 Tax=Amphiura filiformis TaxID=82378 RepID=UPI003B20F0DE